MHNVDGVGERLERVNLTLYPMRDMEERILEIFGKVIDFVLEVALSWSWNQSNVGKFSYCTGFILFWFFILFKEVAERLVVGALGLLQRYYIFQSSFERF